MAKLSFMDRERYLDLQKIIYRLNGMRAELVLAELEDNGRDLNQSRQQALEINQAYGELVKPKIVMKERSRIQAQRDMGPEDDTVKGEDDVLQNIEYAAMLAGMTHQLNDAEEELQKIEAENQLYNQ